MLSSATLVALHLKHDDQHEDTAEAQNRRDLQNMQVNNF